MGYRSQIETSSPTHLLLLAPVLSVSGKSKLPGIPVERRQISRDGAIAPYPIDLVIIVIPGPPSEGGNAQYCVPDVDPVVSSKVLGLQVWNPMFVTVSDENRLQTATNFLDLAIIVLSKRPPEEETLEIVRQMLGQCFFECEFR